MAVDEDACSDAGPDGEVDGIVATLGAALPDLAEDVACPVAFNVHGDAAPLLGQLFQQVPPEGEVHPSRNVRSPDRALLGVHYARDAYSDTFNAVPGCRIVPQPGHHGAQQVGHILAGASFQKAGLPGEHVARILEQCAGDLGPAQVYAYNCHVWLLSVVSVSVMRPLPLRLLRPRSRCNSRALWPAVHP